ncbi:hypothetical protein [Actinacidiphila glaucinigra]|uniref:hypothetical protein n=1 Tax=Actinacidiphila glaucinigra TaxID=235986 RepID=UPI002E310863|nr:hypothetical protein [Actinacidiphila glaucinigra]
MNPIPVIVNTLGQLDHPVVDLRGVDQFRELVRLLERRGYRSERIEKILCGSFLAYASRVWA